MRTIYPEGTGSTTMWKNYLLLFISSACVMTLELVAGRLVAPHIGVSLYTWTGIIGACLCGMSFGNLFGGWLADRGEPRRWLSRIFLVGAAVVAVLMMFQPLLEATAKAVMALDLPPQIGIFALSLFLFGIPCFFISAVSPLVYKIALLEGGRLGTTVGRLAAAGIAGSIVGTYATGFWLIPAFGTQAIVTGVVMALGLLGAASLTWTVSRKATVSALLLALPLGARTAVPAMATSPCDVESAYYCIRVETSEKESATGPVKRLRLDYLVHSGIRVNNPKHLWYEYEQVVGWLFKARSEAEFSSLFLGGGGYILPYWVERHFPEAAVDVVEIDPEVTKVARKEFVPDSRRIRSYHMDARLALLTLPPEQKYDVIFGDVFNDISVPYHLTTAEFAALVRERLTDDGIYVMNVVDRRGEGPFLKAIVATLKQAFPHVYTLPGGDWSDGFRGRTPHVIVASQQPVPWTVWRMDPARPAYDVDLIEVEPGGLVLTDDYAPTDNLLLDVFARRWRSQ